MGPVVLPTVIPLVIGLGEQMRVNRRYTVAMFNPVTGATAAQRLTVTAESLFTVVDSAALDPTRGLWVSALRSEGSRCR